MKSLIALTMALLCAAAGGAHAQPYPSRPVQLIVPYPAGGASDIMARAFAEKLAAGLGAQVIVDNRAGAGGNLAGSAAAKAAPDGYTLFFGAAGPLAVNPALYAKMPFDPAKDFAPIGLVGSMALFLTVPADLPVKSLPDLIALSKARPGALNYASSGVGGTTHLAMEWLKSQAGADITHVPYKGTAAGVADMVGGRIQVIFDAWPTTSPHVRAGKLRYLAVSTARRSALEPEVPTMTELGLSGFDLYVWYGLMAPAGTPAEIVQKLARLTAEITTKADLRERFASLGMEPLTGTPDRFAEHLRVETDKWARIVKLSGAKAE
ncbi:MAG: tripartite tricarboxylate transporter substrate binding protein [Burkholderiales bacterium]|nr:tripartite tricarboxylate transporter substrate binding protein [Burkholderiales bacterium]